jgi:hypothetical protein
MMYVGRFLCNSACSGARKSRFYNGRNRTSPRVTVQKEARVSYQSYPTAEPRDDSPEALRQALAAAQKRLAYFERFGSLIEQQMAALSDHAASVSRETEVEQARHQAMLVQLRREAESLRVECNQRRQEIGALSLHAQSEADRIVAGARQTSSTLVSETIGRLRELNEEVGAAAERELSMLLTAPTNLPGSSFATATPTWVPTAAPPVVEPTPATEASSTSGGYAPYEPPAWMSQTAAPEAAVTPMEGVPSVPETPAPEHANHDDQRVEFAQSPVTIDQTMDATRTAPAAGPAPQDADTVTTRLTVRPSLTGDKLDKFRDTLQSMPGVRQAVVATTTADSTELQVTHAVDSSLLGNLLAIDGLDFRLIGRGEGTLEVEIF